MEDDNCVTCQELDSRIINDTIMMLANPQIEIFIDNTVNRKEKIVKIKNLTEEPIIMNSTYIEYPDFFSIEYQECAKKKGYNVLIKKYESEYSVYLSLDNRKKLFPKEEFKIKMRFEKSGTYRVLTQFYNEKPDDKRVWGLSGVIIEHQSDLFEIK